MKKISLDRRRVLSGLVCGFTLAASTKLRAGEIVTPSQGVGPFYPSELPVNHDNDLTRVSGVKSEAKGEITHLSGCVQNLNGHPLAGALIEIWQCDFFGHYVHELDGGGKDPGFQGYGRTRSLENGAYYFKTIKPVPYPGRAPHIHFRVTTALSELSTQIYIQGHPMNDRDFILNSVSDEMRRSSLLVKFLRRENSSLGDLIAEFDLTVPG